MVDDLSPKWDTQKVRQAFPTLRDVVYLNTGTYGLMPDPALASFIEILAEFERGGVASRANLGAKVEATRQRIAALFGAEPGEIAFTRNATDGVNLVLAGLNWQPGDEVITTDEEHPAVTHPLAYLQRCKGLRIRAIPISPQTDVMLDRLEHAITPNTRLVAMSHVTCETGTRLPARQISEWATERGLLTLFDGAQALGAFPIDVRALGCDFYTSNGHKWLGGPKGSGVFYGRADRLPELFIAHVGAGSLEQADLAAGLAEPFRDARRFEFGTRAWGVYAGLGASLDWFESLGWEQVHRRIANLATCLKDRVRERPNFTLLTPDAPAGTSGLTSFRVDGLDAGELGRSLRERWGIHVRVVTHYNAIRISTAHFNSEEDIQSLMAALDQLVEAARQDRR